jgi:hypothetical protein
VLELSVRRAAGRRPTRRRKKGSWILEPDFTRLQPGLPIDGVDRNLDSVIATEEVVARQIEHAMLKGNNVRLMKELEHCLNTIEFLP